MSEQQTSSMEPQAHTPALPRLGPGRGRRLDPDRAAWPNKDGQGFNISCEAGPLQGRLVLRPIMARDEAEGVRS